MPSTESLRNLINSAEVEVYSGPSKKARFFNIVKVTPNNTYNLMKGQSVCALLQ